MFSHIFKNRLKILLRNKTLIFWTLCFPIALATFFHLAFSNLAAAENFEIVKIAIVENQTYQRETNFKMMMESISKKDKNQVFEIKYVNETKAKELLNTDKIKGYVIMKDKAQMVTSGSGLEASILKSVIDDYYQTTSTINNLVKYDPSILKTNILESFHLQDEYFKDISNKNVDYTVVYFYTLIGMFCLYGGTFGVTTINETEANLSKKGARVSVSPTSKWKVLFSSLLVAFTIQVIESFIVLGYITLVLGVNFGPSFIYVLLLTIVGCLVGISLGSFVAAASKKSLNAKIGILFAITMTCSFLAGMMVIDLKYIIAKNVPLLANINPVSLITDGLYSLYYYTDHTRFYSNIGYLSLIIILLGIGSYLCMRRKKYDSL